MRSFIKGVLGGFLVVIAAVILIPAYSDFRSRSETSDWLKAIAPTKSAISGNILKQRSLSNSGINAKIPSSLNSKSTVTISADGIIFIQGGIHGQVVALIPKLSNDKVTWTCIGGAAKDVPISCRAP